MRWAFPSREIIVNCTARKAGEDTVGGSSLSPARMMNVAGTRALVEPPEVPAPVVGPVVPPGLVGLVVAVLAGAVEVVEGWIPAELDVGLELPQAPISRKVGSSTRTDSRRLTLSA